MYYQFQNRTYTIVSRQEERLAIDPVPNPELETRYVDADLFFCDAKPLPDRIAKEIDESVRFQDGTRKEPEKGQDGARKRPEKDQKKARKKPFLFKLFSDEKFENMDMDDDPTEKRLKTLENARLLVSKDPYDVMRDNWDVIRWIDSVYSLEKLEKLPSFPRRVAKRINNQFGLNRSRSFYQNLVEYYVLYKKSLPVPLWWLKVETWLESNFFILLQD